jgi:hypothetical protein
MKSASTGRKLILWHRSEQLCDELPELQAHVGAASVSGGVLCGHIRTALTVPEAKPETVKAIVLKLP